MKKLCLKVIVEGENSVSFPSFQLQHVKYYVSEDVFQ